MEFVIHDYEVAHVGDKIGLSVDPYEIHLMKVEKEKGIICEEVKMGKNNPGHKLYYGMNKALYKKDKSIIICTR
mgnify:CR=1 FL=1